MALRPRTVTLFKFIELVKYSHTRTSLDFVHQIWNVARFLLSFHVDYELHYISEF